MASENEIQIHSDAGLAERAATAAIAEVRRLESKYSRYREDSVVSAINASAGRHAVTVDDETLALLDYAQACHAQSDGLFDPTSGVLRRAWRFESGRVPTDDDLSPLLPLVGWDKIERDGRTIRLALAGMELDFGGFGKEYASDRAAAVLRGHGIVSGLVNLAGDLVVLGPAPDASAWQVGIRHPRDPASLVARWPVVSGALATSGDYERFIETDGVRHCHVLDPRTGRSVRGLQSATVQAQSCLVAGSATTIAMLKGEAEGLAWLANLGLPWLAVAGDGRVIDRTS
jgi:thiamine biosynthesis lipoprotein